MVLDELKLEGNVAVLMGRKGKSLKVLARALAEAGATVVVAGTVRGDIEEAAADVIGAGLNALAVQTDLTSSESVRLVKEKTLSTFGRIDILVNDTAVQTGKPFLELSETEWERAMELNVKPLFLSCKLIGAHMQGQRSGSIVNITSGLAERGLPNGTAYCASMGAVSQLTRSLALEWAPDNVRINAIGVGWIEDQDESSPDDPVARFIPMGRRGRPDDIAPLVILLASNASSYLTGHLYLVDGGLMARG
jgi:2-deoxy-D-gluconate 3-dehydrogenase